MIYNFLKGVVNSLVRLSERVTHTHTRVVPFADRKASEESDYCCAAEWSSRVVFLNEKWDFCYFSNGLAKNIFDSDNASYVDISVPSSWQDAGIIDKKYLEGYAFSASGKKVSAGKKSGNGVGIYRRKVEVYDFTKKYFLTFDRVDGYFEVYLNGNLCGFSYTGKGEFDVTDKLVSGENELLVLVREYTKASFIEGQRRFASSGITGDVYFTLRNETYLSDISFSSTLIDGVYNARLTLYTEGETPDTEICFSLEKDGKVIFDETRIPEKKIEYDFNGEFTPYLNENPALYDLFVTIKELGETIECSRFKVGFGNLVYADSIACFNGQPVKIYGVDYNPVYNAQSKPMTFEDYKADFLTLRKFGFNAICTKTYLSDSVRRLALTEGLYVVDEIPVCVSAELYKKNKRNFVAYDTEFKDLIVTKTLDEYNTNKSYCNVIAYSFVNAKADMPNFAAAVNALKGVANVRVFIPEAKSDEAAVIVNPTVDDFIDEINKVSASRPVYMADYAESFGIGNAGLSEFAELVENTPCAMGGCVSSFTDDFIEGVSASDGGMFTIDRKPYAAAYCNRFISRPVKVKLAGEDKIEIFNNSYFNDTSYIDVMISVVDNGKLRSKVKLNVTVEPRQSRIFDVFIGHKDGDMYLNVECFIKDTEELLSVEQVSVHSDMVGLDNLEEGKNQLSVTEKFDVVEIRFDAGSVRFSKVTGSIIGYNLGGKEILNPIASRNGGACFNTKINRPFVRNVLNDKYHVAEYETVGFELFEKGNAVDVKITQVIKFRKKAVYTVTDNYTVHANGVIDLKSSLFPGKKCPSTLDCFGKQLRFYPSFERVTFYGKGDGDNYIDLCAHSVTGIYDSTASEMGKACAFGQECGNRTDVHYVVVRDNDGDGIMVEATVNPVQIRVTSASDDEIVKGYKEKTLVKKSGVYVDVNAVVSGYGSGNGAKPLAKYTLMSGEQYLNIRVVPVIKAK